MYSMIHYGAGMGVPEELGWFDRFMQNVPSPSQYVPELRLLRNPLVMSIVQLKV